MIYLYLVVWGLLGLAGGVVAAHKGYPPVLGILAAVFLGPLGIILAALIPSTPEGRQRKAAERETRLELRETRELRVCPQCQRENSVASPVCPRCNHRFEEARPTA